MKTIIKKVDQTFIDENIIKEAGDIIKAGGLVAFPTETVYGLGADALNTKAAKKIYEAKGRPSDNPLIVHIAKLEDLETIAKDIPKTAYLLAEKFWPGPLTMILNKTNNVPLGTTGGLETVAIRMPSNKIATQLINASGGFIAAPSANTSGRPSPTLAAHVEEDLKGTIDMIIDGGMVDIGVESSIIDLTVTPPMVLRPGAITKTMMEAVIGEVSEDVTLMKDDDKHRPKAPGMKYRHYAPKAELILVEGEMETVIKNINVLSKEAVKEGKKVGVIATGESRDRYEVGEVKSIGTRAKEETIAHHLYQILREFDDDKVDIIYSEAFETKGIGKAIMNRLLKAAGHHILKV